AGSSSSRRWKRRSSSTAFDMTCPQINIPALSTHRATRTWKDSDSIRFRYLRSRSMESGSRSRCSWCTDKIQRSFSQYRFSAEETRPIQLELRPLIGFRDYHALTHENDALERSVHLHDEKLASVQPYPDHPVLYFAHDANDLNTQGYWYKNFDYALERERGLDFVEDLFNPLTFRFEMAGRDTATVITSTEILDVRSAGRLRDEESKRRSEVAARAP